MRPKPRVCSASAQKHATHAAVAAAKTQTGMSLTVPTATAATPTVNAVRRSEGSLMRIAD